MENNKSTPCRRCGRALKNPESIKLGYGPSCAKKVQLEKPREEEHEKQSMIDDYLGSNLTTFQCKICGFKYEHVKPDQEPLARLYMFGHINKKHPAPGEGLEYLHWDSDNTIERRES
jgi:hypothetical protein